MESSFSLELINDSGVLVVEGELETATDESAFAALDGLIRTLYGVANKQLSFLDAVLTEKPWRSTMRVPENRSVLTEHGLFNFSFIVQTTADASYTSVRDQLVTMADMAEEALSGEDLSGISLEHAQKVT